MAGGADAGTGPLREYAPQHRMEAGGRLHVARSRVSGPVSAGGAAGGFADEVRGVGCVVSAH